MKDTYIRYGTTTHTIEESLSEEDRATLNKFMDYCSVTASRSRILKYKSSVLQFRDIMEKPFSEVTAQDAMRFWRLVNESSYQEKTRIDIKRAVKRFLKFTFRDFEMLELLPIGDSAVNHDRINRNTLFTEKELSLMLHRAESLRDKALLTILYETAARPQEIRDLRWGDVNWAQEEVRLYSKKTKSDRSLPVRETLKQLKRWHDEWILPDPQASDAVFPAIVSGRCQRERGLSTDYINRTIQKLAEQIGITRKVNTYLMRHSRLTELHHKQVQGRDWKAFAGHTPGSKMETVYIHLNNEDMKQSIISKVYGVSKISKTEREEYDDRFKRLEQSNQKLAAQNQALTDQLSGLMSYLRDSQGVMQKATVAFAA